MDGTPANSPSMALRPVGVVRNGCREKPDGPWEEVVSEIVVEEGLADGLEGIEEFSHIHLLFWLHQMDSERATALRLHPENREDLPERGVFATRSPRRPNPIGLTTVRLLERRGNLLRVLGLDALDGTPILDIKPYLTRGDLWPEATTPAWLKRLWGEAEVSR